MICSVKAFSALRAHVRLLSGVFPHMIVQAWFCVWNSFHTEGRWRVSLRCELLCEIWRIFFSLNLFPALRTLVRLLSGVDSHVCFKPVFTWETRSHTQHNVNGFSPVVNSYVNLKDFFSLWISFRTEDTCTASLRCDSHVCFKPSLRGKLYSTLTHVNGFSPVWTLTCRVRKDFRVKHLSTVGAG